MGDFKPYPSYGEDPSKAFLEKTFFECLHCSKECKILDGTLISKDNKVFVIGCCNQCFKKLEIDVTNDWVEE